MFPLNYLILHIKSYIYIVGWYPNHIPVLPGLVRGRRQAAGDPALRLLQASGAKGGMFTGARNIGKFYRKPWNMFRLNPINP